ncbi:MAG TPA: hypothetical protein VLJ68_03710, partial [Chitinophagaceae bacterium]|nr:hypothetical protein [Chitinophagaceae bacterium]
MSIVVEIKPLVAKALHELFNYAAEENEITINQTKPEFEGDYTLVLFSFVKTLKQSPESLGEAIGKKMLENHPALFSAYNVIKGFLNLTIRDVYWLAFIESHFT